MKYSQGGLDAYNVLDVTNTDTDLTPSVPVAQAITNRVTAAFKQHCRNTIVGECALVEVTYTDRLNSDQYARTVAAADGQGTATGGAAPINCCQLIRKQLEGSRRTGFMYVPGLPESQVSAGSSILGTWVTLLSAQWTQFLNNLATNTINVDEVPVQMIVYRPGGISSQVTGMAASNVVAVQNRRRS